MIDIKSHAQDYFSGLQRVLKSIDYDQLERTVKALLKAYQKDKTVYVFGNGGGASLATHLACDLGKNTLGRVYDEKEKRLNVISLTDNVPLLTAYANDLSYDDIFVQQLKNSIKKGDIVMAITGSGTSRNINKAIRYAKKKGAVTIALLGFGDGGKTGRLVDYPITVKSNHYGHIEGAHTEIGHFFTEIFFLLKREVDGRGKPRPVSRAGTFQKPTLEIHSGKRKSKRKKR